MQKQRRRRLVILVLVVLATGGWGLFDYLSSQNYEIPAKDQSVLSESQSQSPSGVILAAEALGRLAVKATVTRDGYSREQFGDGWGEINGCDLRNLVLKRDLVEVTIDDDNCVVLSGNLNEDPYTGKNINFKRGRDTSDDVQIDHVVALNDAWIKGAQQLNSDKRQQFANDPLNLLAVDGPANMQKSANDAAGWLPRAEYRCRYVARQIAVKAEYNLWVSPEEKNAMQRTLGNCPDQVLPIRG